MPGKNSTLRIKYGRETQKGRVMFRRGNFYPLVVAYGFLKDSTFTFIIPGQEITVEGVNEILSSLLPECNGYRTVNEVITNTVLKSGATESEIYEVVEVLFEHQILVEAQQLYQLFHRASANPAPFWWELKNKELLAMLRDSSPFISNSSPTRSTLEMFFDQRTSTREFSGDPLTYEEVIRLCWATYGQIKRSDRFPELTIGLGTVPSAGGLYPLNLYAIVVRECDKFAKGIYLASPSGLTLQSPVDLEKLWHVIDGVPEAISGAALVLVLTCNFHRITQKYANRGYRYALLEAGHAAQNAYLWCIEQGLGIVENGGFNDEELAKILQIPYLEHAPLITLIIGRRIL